MTNHQKAVVMSNKNVSSQKVSYIETFLGVKITLFYCRLSAQFGRFFRGRGRGRGQPQNPADRGHFADADAVRPIYVVDMPEMRK